MLKSKTYMDKKLRIWAGLIFLLGISLVVSANEYSSSSYVEFTNGNYVCFKGTNFAYWANYTTSENYTMILPKIFDEGNSIEGGNCSSYSEQTGITCCPGGYNCNLDSGKCEEIKEEIYCAKFTTKTSCEANPEVGDEELRESEFVAPDSYVSVCRGSGNTYMNGSSICQKINNCECYWEDNECLASSVERTICANDDSFNDTVNGRCSYKIVNKSEDCSGTGKVILKYGVTANPPEHSCPSIADKVYSCDSLSVVPFFDWSNFFVALLAIGLGYFLLGRSSR